jgi:hypothetical protein
MNLKVIKTNLVMRSGVRQDRIVCVTPESVTDYRFMRIKRTHKNPSKPATDPSYLLPVLVNCAR